jgi:cytochrome P450
VHLARLEVTILITEWLKRVADFEVDVDAAWRPPSSFQWGWNSLPVSVTASVSSPEPSSVSSRGI